MEQARMRGIDFESEAWLYEWVNNSGEGIWSFSDIPEDCLNFIIGTFHHLGYQLPPEVWGVAKVGIEIVFHVCSIHAPYTLFRGVSDVDIVESHNHFVYKVRSLDGRGSTVEADPEETEVYVYRPGQAEEFYRYAIENIHKGLDAFPFSLGDFIREHLHGDYGSDFYHILTFEEETALREICSQQGPYGPQFNKKMFEAYFELAAWAAFVWLAGPYGRQYRIDNILLMNEAIQCGECLLNGTNIIGSDYYIKENRLPRSCFKCGHQTWCVELVQVEHHQTFICEHCARGDFPASQYTNCGTRSCATSGCPNHPFHHLGKEGMFRAAAQYGQLNQIVRDKNREQIAEWERQQIGY